nr:3'-5' exonuclease [Vibrio anguillarum]
QIHDSRTSYRWQSLTNACKQQGVDVSDLSAHRALADCEMTRRLIHAVNAKIEAR